MSRSDFHVGLVWCGKSILQREDYMTFDAYDIAELIEQLFVVFVDFSSEISIMILRDG